MSFMSSSAQFGFFFLIAPGAFLALNAIRGVSYESMSSDPCSRSLL